MSHIGKTAAAVAALSMVWSGEAFAGPHEDANAAHARGDYATELAILKPAAEAGEVWAENNLGRSYAEGDGVPHDDALATKWFEKAAAAGNANAQRNLFGLYLTGHAKPSDPKDAAEYEKLKAMMKFTGASMNCMLKKPTAAEDCPKAAALLQEGAKAGDPDFEEKLGQAYLIGSYGLPRDPAQGFAWTQKAADQGSQVAELMLAQDYSVGVGVTADEAKARAWLTKAAEQGNTLAASELADDYEQGRGVAKDTAQAFHWLLKAAEGEDQEAQKKVGAAYAFGRGTARDDVKAWMWIDVALSGPGSRDETHDAQVLALKAVQARLKPTQLAEAQAMAAQWKSAHPLWNLAQTPK